MTNDHGEIDTPPEKLWSKGSFLGCFELCAGSSSPSSEGASSVESEVFEFAVGLTVLLVYSDAKAEVHRNLGSTFQLGPALTGLKSASAKTGTQTTPRASSK